MTYTLIKNGTVVEYPYSLNTFRSTNPAVSLPLEPTETQLNEQGIYTVYPTNKPVYDTITQNCNEITPTIQDVKWTQTWSVTAATPQEIEYRESNAKAENSARATQLLQDTDWTEGKSVRDETKSPHLTNGESFDDYRVLLRAIAVNPPVVVSEWPVRPDEIWSNQ